MALLRKQLSCSSLKSSRTTNIQYSKQQSLPPGSITEFVWKDYSTAIFRNIQQLGNVSGEDYIVAVRQHEILMDLAMKGGSRKPLFLPHDGRFIIKILRKSEAKLLMEILPSYYDHIKKHEKCLLEKYYGLHATKPAGIGGPKAVRPERHSSRKNPRKPAPNPSRMNSKELDFDFCFLLQQSTRNQLLEQLKVDCSFLEEHSVMGYSMLLGVHKETLPKVNSTTTTTSTATTDITNESAKADSVKKSTVDDSKQVQHLEIHHYRDPTLADFFSPANRPGSRFGSNIPAQAIRISSQSNIPKSNSTRKEDAVPDGSTVYLHLGIIYFLKNYSVIRRIEHVYKTLQFNAKDIPSVKPQHYATQFQEFLRQVFLADDCSPGFIESVDLSKAFS